MELQKQNRRLWPVAALVLVFCALPAHAHGERALVVVLFIPIAQLAALVCSIVCGYFWNERFLIKFAVFTAALASIPAFWMDYPILPRTLSNLTNLSDVEMIATGFSIPLLTWFAGYFFVRMFRSIAKPHRD